MKNKITVIFSSRKKSDDNFEFIEHINNTCGCECLVMAVYNPDGLSLSKVYAELIEMDEIDDDILVFIHDDIEFLKNGWGKEI